MSQGFLPTKIYQDLVDFEDYVYENRISDKTKPFIWYHDIVRGSYVKINGMQDLHGVAPVSPFTLFQPICFHHLLDNNAINQPYHETYSICHSIYKFQTNWLRIVQFYCFDILLLLLSIRWNPKNHFVFLKRKLYKPREFYKAI